MESSFFEYRNKTGVDSESDSEIIDDSLIDESISLKKKNRTVFVAESDESTEEESENSASHKEITKSVIRQSSVAEPHIISSSDDDASNRGSVRRSSMASFHNVVLNSSSDEEDASPEMLPRRRQQLRSKSGSDESIIGRKSKKRVMRLDSDTENSIVIEHNKNNKVVCLKDTPLKLLVDKQRKEYSMKLNQSMDYDDYEVIDNERSVKDVENEVSEDSGNDDESSNNSNDENAGSGDDCKGSANEHVKENAGTNDDGESIENEDDSKKADSDDDYNGNEEDSDEGPDEDQMVMSRATRMSIMGVLPKGNDSDESDFIQSDDSNLKSRHSGSANSLSELPDMTAYLHKSPEKEVDSHGSDTSRISCSPIRSPLQNISNVHCNDAESKQNSFSNPPNAQDDAVNALKTKVLNNLNKDNFVQYDDDVTIIETKSEIISLSSDDDEDEGKAENKSPKIKKSPKPKKSKDETIDVEEAAKKRSKDNTIKQYLVPPSYPNQVVYVKKHVRENELSKLNGLKEDLQNIRYLLENMDVDTLPDGGVKLIERLTALEAEVRRQGDKVANMVVEPDEASTVDLSKHEAYDREPTWEELRKAGDAVQPRMFGKQAMATHMAERNLILERLRDLHESLASRPPDSATAPPPAALASELMPHQRHALAWLRWRETQRPAAGILADDMGLGKTITMIALVAGDNEQADEDDQDDEELRGTSKLARGGTLVVCPASLMQQWGGEVARHCRPHALRVALHHGAARATHPHRLAAEDLVVTTYNILQRDNEKNGVLMRILWRRVILDEAHIVRNHKSATSVAVSALKARRRWCLTGTPVQNKDFDLFALIKFLKCSPFDELTMWKKWIDNKSLGGQERLSTVLRCVVLRRTKLQLQQRGQLACLPPRRAHQRPVTLSTQEMNVYQKVLVFSKTLFAQFLHQRAEKNADSASLTAAGKDSEYAKMHKRMIALQGAKPVKSHEILVLLLRLRQVCCHCGLIAAMLHSDAPEPDAGSQDLLADLNKLSLDESTNNSKGDKPEEDEDLPQEGTTADEAIRSVLSLNNPVFELKRPSSKIKAVMECLNNEVFVNEGEKAVVVSQWTSVLRLVQKELEAGGVRSVTLSGAVPVPARPPLIAALNDPRSPVKVMLLSLCAGGVGLNLCGANHLLLLDPHWNPQLEEQAQDRIYRVGQDKPVAIYRFMCVDTVEQTIRKLQEAKLELAENVLTGAKNTNASKLSIEDLKMLFNMGQ